MAGYIRRTRGEHNDTLFVGLHTTSFMDTT